VPPAWLERRLGSQSGDGGRSSRQELMGAIPELFLFTTSLTKLMRKVVSAPMRSPLPMRIIRMISLSLTKQNAPPAQSP